MAYKGARYRKADFQIHSPRDRGWDGTRPEDGMTASSSLEAVRDEWSKKFIEKCLDQGLRAVALTDHHEVVWTWPVIAALKKLKAADQSIDFWVFPAMELTAKDSAQALILFDADITPVLIEAARQRLGLPVNCNPEQAKGIEVELLTLNIADIQGALETHDELRGRFIILPNVTPEGHKTVLRKGFQLRFKEMPYVGGYLDRRYPDDLKPGDRSILDGEIPAWTSERRGVISTSDARHADFRLIGQHASWVKLAQPTAESIRQAMLAADSRISYTEPIPPAVHVLRLQVIGADFLSLDALELSPQYNALIGGRGAGKSTLLEFIRYAVGRSASDFTELPWDLTQERRKAILEQALRADTGQVRLTLSMDGAEVVLIRTRAKPEQIEMNVAGAPRILSPKDVREIIPFQVFSQGELSHLGSEASEKRLLEIVTDPNRPRFDSLKASGSQAKAAISSELERLTNLWSAEQRLRRTEAEISTTRARIAALRQQLGALPAETQQALNAHAGYEAGSRLLNELQRLNGAAASEAIDGLAQLRGSLERAIESPPEGFAETSEATEITRTLIGVIQGFEESLGASITTAVDALAPVRESWVGKVEEHNRKYQEALASTASQRQVAEQLTALEKRLGELEDAKRRIDEEMRGLIDAKEKFSAAVKDFKAAQKEVETEVAKLAITVEQLSNGLATASVQSGGDLSALLGLLTDLFAGTSVRQNRLEDLVAQVRGSASPLDAWWIVLSEILALLYWKLSGRRETEPRPAIPQLEPVIDSGGLDRFVERLSKERIVPVLHAEIGPRLEVLQRRTSGDIVFKLASQGERAATLVTMLMHQSGGPLVIDQPEEDLDNRIIGEIVNATRKAKIHRQLILATHNANLVVNGDAELVVELAAGKIVAEGAIDDQVVKDSITATMEGGKEAFELRRKKYNY